MESAEAALELARLDEAIELKNKELDDITQKIVDGWLAYADETAELTASIREWQAHLKQIKERSKQYEDAASYTREKDKKRKEELDKKEANLKGRERRLAQDIADFEHRKKRAEQLKEIQ